MNAERARAAIRAREWLLAALAASVLIAALVQTGLVLNRYERQAAFETDADALSDSVEADIDKLEASMGTLVSAHYTDAASNGANSLTASLEQLRGNSPHVSGIGRYAVLESDERETFERTERHSGLYAFRVTAIDTDGHADPRAPAERYHPITRLEPMDPALTRLLGADLGTDERLAAALDSLVLQDTTLLTTLPAHWPLGERLFLFHATYRGQHVPRDAFERHRQLDGGYWMAIDTDAMLAGGAERLGLTLHVEARGERRRLSRRIAGETGGLHFSGLYREHESERRWPLGEGAIVLTLTAESGMSSRLLFTLVLLVLLVPVSIGIGLAFLRNGRLRICERLRADAALNAERAKAERTLNAIEDAVFKLDAGHRVRHLNPAALRLIGRSRDEAIGQPIAELIDFHHERDGRAFEPAATLAAFERSGVRDVDLVCGARLRKVRPDGARATDETRHLDDSDEERRRETAPVADTHHADTTVLRLTITRTCSGDAADGGADRGHILVLRDISAERRLTRRLEQQANHDPLTGCTNRRYFEAKLRELLDGLPASGRHHALCYIDLDQFKVVNDTCGHSAGDRLLQELTVELIGMCREGDVLSRLGGDEFGLIIVDADVGEAHAVAERVLAFFRGYTFRHGEREFAIRASIGFVPLDAHSGSICQVLAAADLACYAAKDGGRDELYVWSADDENIVRRSSELNQLPELQRALAEDLFTLHVQAVARISPQRPDGEITHFEFLLRPCDESGRPVPPMHLIDAAERYGLMRDIDRWVIERALAAVAGIEPGLGEELSFSINLSGQSAADPTLIEFIENAYERHAIDPARIWFELTETAAISHFSIAVELAERIRALGSKIALDDFGSGLSSFGYLKNIPVDVLKIDGQFVRNMASDAVDRTMVRAIDEVGKSMGIVTVAEFVENGDIVEELVRIGVDYAQGYHIARPCPLPEALAALSAARSTTLPPHSRAA